MADICEKQEISVQRRIQESISNIKISFQQEKDEWIKESKTLKDENEKLKKEILELKKLNAPFEKMESVSRNMKMTKIYLFIFFFIFLSASLLFFLLILRFNLFFFGRINKIKGFIYPIHYDHLYQNLDPYRRVIR